MASLSVGQSIQTDTMDSYDDDDVVVAQLEDPAVKYGLNKVSRAKPVPGRVPQEVPEVPGDWAANFWGSKLMWLGLCWMVLLVVIIIVAVRATADSSDDPAVTVAP